MTDSRLRGEWLNSMKFDDLSDSAWRVFTSALMWCNENGTDGFVPTRYLKMLHPDGIKADAHAELSAAGLWEQLPSGYQLKDWAGLLGQSTASEVDTYKANARERAKKYRDRQRAQTARRVGFSDSSESVTRDVHEHVRTHVGKGTGEGEAQDKGTEKWFVNDETGEVKDEDSNPVPAPWGFRVCVVCGTGIPTDSPVPWCPIQNDEHNRYRSAAA